MNAIEINNLTKIYRLYKSHKDRVKEILTLNTRKHHHDFYALKDVSFSIKKGETVGIIGQNGSGKSTLLKLICGVTKPTSGSVKVNGRISSLLELGAGFHPDFTGRENVYMNGALMGFSKEEMEKRLPEIEAFADIGEFIDQPVKSYSSGMYVRLAFAAAINIDPEILIVDEALSVGDMFFQAKCMAQMKKMLDNGITLFFVTHDLVAVKSLCEKSIMLSHGALVDFDDSIKVVDKYYAMKISNEQRVVRLDTPKKESNIKQMLSEDEKRRTLLNSSKFEKSSSFERIQNGKARFINIQLLNESGDEINFLNYEQEVTLRMAIEIMEDIPKLAFGYHIRNKNGVSVVYSDSVIENKILYSVKKDEKYIIDWKFKASLTQGIYNVVCVLSIPLDMTISKYDYCDYIPLAVQFTVAPRKGSYLYGSVHWENQVEIRDL